MRRQVPDPFKTRHTANLLSETVNWCPVDNIENQSRDFLRRTVPSLLEEACDRNPTSMAFNQWRNGSWVSHSTLGLRDEADRIACGLTRLNLARSDRICLFMHSDADFVIADMACLISGMIDVPIYLTHTHATIQFILKHAQARAMVVSNTELLDLLVPSVQELSYLETIIVNSPVAELEPYQGQLSAHGVEAISWETVVDLGAEVLAQDPEAARRLRSETHPHEPATIVYTSGTTGDPKGVMLSHENLSFNVLSAFAGMHILKPGSGQVALSFLPLTHAFARMMNYGYMNYGMQVYFTDADHLRQHLAEVRPTTFATVPRVLEKLYDRILEKGGSLVGVRKKLFQWGLAKAQNFRIRTLARRRISDRIADRLVFSRWRKALGNRIEFIISGGAALREDLVRIYAAAGIQILQGYGLTETSPVISFNRPDDNRAGTVGTPLEGIEVKIAEDGEILTRGPHVMRGYYRSPQLTTDCIDSVGWFHTGDIGELGQAGHLSITDRKKDLFKLSTGKYVIPQPLENRLRQDPLIEQALILGREHPYCTALIFPSLDLLPGYARRYSLPEDLSVPDLLRQKAVHDHFVRAVEEANQGLPPWSTIKKFEVLPDGLSIENGLLTPTLKVRRTAVLEHYHQEIDNLYEN